MNRSFRLFAGFCLLLLVGIIGFRWWLGPVMSELMFDDQRRADPLMVLSFVRAAGGARTDPGAVAGKVRALNSLMAAEGGRLAWEGSTQLVITGRVEDEWQHVTALRFDAGAAFVDVFTSGAYRDAQSVDPQTDSLLLLARTMPAAPLSPADRVVVFLLSEPRKGARATAATRLIQTARDYGARELWRSPVNVLRGDGTGALMIMIAFTPDSALEQWLADERADLDRSIARREFGRIRVAIWAPEEPNRG